MTQTSQTLRAMLDIDFVRAQFPAFSSAALQGQMFFENAGGSYTCKPVIDRLFRFYHDRKVQPYAPYEASRLGGAEMDEARARLAAMMGIETDELSFGPSTSANTFVLSNAVRLWLKGKNAAIVVTNQDHEANSGVWRRLADEGIELREWRIDSQTGHLDPAALAPLLADGKVKLVCFPHCSNIVAEINPVAEICAMARAAGAFTCVDGVSYAPHGFPDMAELGADVYLFSAYKTYGPHQGIMVIRRGIGAELPNQAHFFNGDVLYKRFTPAGPDHAQVAACAGMADYVDALYAHHFGAAAASPVQRNTAVHDLMRDHEIALTAPLLDYLAARNDRTDAQNPAEMEISVLDVEMDVAARAGTAHAQNELQGHDFAGPRSRQFAAARTEHFDLDGGRRGMDLHRELGRKRTGIQHGYFECLLPPFRPMSQIVAAAISRQHRSAERYDEPRDRKRHASGQFLVLPRRPIRLPFRIHVQDPDPGQSQRPPRPSRRRPPGPEAVANNQRPPKETVQPHPPHPQFPFGHLIGQIGHQHQPAAAERSQKQAFAQQKDAGGNSQQEDGDPVAHGRNHTGLPDSAKVLFSACARHQRLISAPVAHQGFCSASRASSCA